MTPIQDTRASFRFSTDDLPEAIRAKAVRELHERTPVPGKIEPLEPLPGASVRVEITKLTLPGVGLMAGTLAGLRQAARPLGAVATGEDDLLLAVNLRGRSFARQRDREFILEEGDAMLAPRGSNGFTITRATPVRFMGFRVPRPAIAALAARVDAEAPIRLVRHGSDALDLLVGYAGAVANGPALHAPELQRLVVTHVHDLIAAIAGAARDSMAIVGARGIRAARVKALMADILQHLEHGDLTPAAVARRQRITPRYVHKLLESEGLTFSSFVLEQRLARVYRTLSDPRRRDRTISAIAFDIGFNDLSYFNRAFRRRYGATPSDIRRSAPPQVVRTAAEPAPDACLAAAAGAAGRG
jgi:AraC-like DNA-binding protein